MYLNLDKEISTAKMSWRSSAEAIGMPEATFRDKIRKENFTIEEAFRVKERLFPKFTLEYLFEQEEK